MYAYKEQIFPIFCCLKYQEVISCNTTETLEGEWYEGRCLLSVSEGEEGDWH